MTSPPVIPHPSQPPPFLSLPVLAVTQDEAIQIIRSQKVFRRALAAGWIKPVIQGGRGRTSVFDYGDVAELWKRLKTEKPPKLPCELRGSVRKFFGQLWDVLRGAEPEPEPIYVFLSREDVEREMAQKYAEAQKEREAEALEEEKQRFREGVGKQESEKPTKTVSIEIDL